MLKTTRWCRSAGLEVLTALACVSASTVPPPRRLQHGDSTGRTCLSSQTVGFLGHGKHGRAKFEMRVVNDPGARASGRQ